MGIEKDFTSLEIYRLAQDLAVEIYRVTIGFPKEEIYGITSQLRRASVSIAINIAEGYGRFHFKDRTLFIYNARGSLLETKSLLFISRELGFIDTKKVELAIKKINKLGIKINNFINFLKANK